MALFGLLGDYGSGSESDSDDSSEDGTQPTDDTAKSDNSRVAKNEASALPTPALDSIPTVCSKTVPSQSIYHNPYEKAAEARQSILEKHVKVTFVPPIKPGDEHSRRKRKTRGNNFRTGPPGPPRNQRIFTPVAVPNHLVAHDFRALPGLEGFKFGGVPAAQQDDEDGFKYERKKRVGIRDCLEPPRRAMDDLKRQRREERPWTMKKYYH